MFAVARRVVALCLLLVPFSAFASSEWQQPTAEELSMKSYPADPDAPAVYLYREEVVDDNIHIHTVYARIKVLSEKGKEMFGNIEIEYNAGHATIRDVSGRTIHSDGTVIPFTGKPYDKMLVKQGNIRVMAKVFSMPDVQVGSILEFRWVLSYDDDWILPPQWYIQRDVPVLKAHYHFVSSDSRGGNLRYILVNEYGHQIVANQLIDTPVLPPGDKVIENVDGTFDVNVENIPALPHEDYMPPLQSLSYRVIFYYSPFRTGEEYWRTLGKYWSEDFNHFANPSGKIHDAVNGIVAPGDSDQQKVQKIYASVMKLENTDFTREHTVEENKAEGVKVKSAEDIWAQQRGTGDEITRLFVAMVRAAGLKAYGAIVTNRDENLFVPGYLYWNQLDDELAIVSLNGKEVFFDPGQRYCEFGKLHWKHTWAGGVRQTDGGTELFNTPGPTYQDNATDRRAQLTLDANGQVHGQIHELMTGSIALRWRQAALRGDEAGVKKAFEEDMQHSMPAGVQVKMDHFLGLTDYTSSLMAIVNVSGTLGTATGKHVFFPGVFFEAGNAPLFAETHRENMVDMRYPYMVHDQFQLTLPPNMTVESLPQSGDVPYVPNADYLVKFVSQGNVYAYGRLLRVASSLYKASEYPGLRTFFQKVSTDDQQQVALKAVAVAATAPAPAKAAAPAGGK